MSGFSGRCDLTAQLTTDTNRPCNQLGITLSQLPLFIGDVIFKTDAKVAAQKDRLSRRRQLVTRDAQNREHGVRRERIDELHQQPR